MWVQPQVVLPTSQVVRWQLAKFFRYSQGLTRRDAGKLLGVNRGATSGGVLSSAQQEASGGVCLRLADFDEDMISFQLGTQDSPCDTKK